jgi:hypothetical protein
VGWLGGKGSKHSSYGRVEKGKEKYFSLFKKNILGKYLMNSYNYNQGCKRGGNRGRSKETQ